MIVARGRPLLSAAVLGVTAQIAGCAAATHEDGNVTLVWAQPPAQERAAESIVSGYLIYFWSAAEGHPITIDVPDPGRRRYRVEGLAPGEYYFTMVSYDQRGVQSELSNVLRKIVR